ncbi:MAG: hypothetical protein ACOY33_07965 [Pseudomonadota bacterium]
MKAIHLAVAAAVAGLLATGSALAKDLLTKEQYIDYSAQVKCAEQKYSYSDPDRYEKELDRIEKTFGIKDKDIESGRMDDLAVKYDAEPDTYDAVDTKKAALCPQPAE